MDLSMLGIPSNKIEQFKKAGISSIEELAHFYPKRYEDFRKPVPIQDLDRHIGETVAFVGKITHLKRGVGYVSAQVEDEKGNYTYVTWFNQMYLYTTLHENDEYVFYGKISMNWKTVRPEMAAPVFYSNDPLDFGKILPVYKKIKGMSYDYLVKNIAHAAGILIADTSLTDPIPDEILKMAGAPGLKRFLVMAHQPQDENELKAVEARKIVDELYPFSVKMTERRLKASMRSLYVARSTALLKQYIVSLPFELTPDQMEAINRIAETVQNGKRADILVQGDVGCGKTIVAIAASVLMSENNYQTAVMAPTTVLAEQHYQEFKKYLEPAGIHVVLLTSGMKKKERDIALSKIESGEAQVVVGTHSVISQDVVFKALAMTIVDEEHRFGVNQRQLLREKANSGVHSISMTATPIPRTLAITLYGENTQVLNITTMPAGRKPIVTVAHSDYAKVFAAMNRQVLAGHQCYLVCPMIDDSDNEALANVESVDTVFKKLKTWLEENNPAVTVDRITGDIKPETIRSRLNAFATGKTKILVSTTIVEVGVNVPNATVMVISNAERFGLAQLHQLRGRVGRGDDQSYCVLISKKMTPRIRAMIETTNGFEISKKDFELRGSGDVVGTKQHGEDRCVNLMLQYPELYKKFCQYAETICS